MSLRIAAVPIAAIPTPFSSSIAALSRNYLQKFVGYGTTRLNEILISGCRVVQPLIARNGTFNL
jgi:hypothetical protein